MKFLNNLKLRNKILANLSIAAVGFIILIIIAVYYINSVAKMYELSLYHEGIKGQNFVLNADRDMYQALTAKRAVLSISPGSENFESLIKEYQDNIQQTTERIDSALAIVEKNHPHWESLKHNDNGQNFFSAYDEFKKEFDSWVNASNQLVE